MSLSEHQIAVIGGGISGLAVASMLQQAGYGVQVYERADRPGGLVKCSVVNSCLYHLTGGHVFNSKREDVLDWFWGRFDKERDFLRARRNAVASLEDGQCIGYPVENHLYQFDSATRSCIIRELLASVRRETPVPTTLGAFFDTRFGPTLNKLYFTPYNNKIWGRDISNLPLDWLQGKLPMPTLEDIFENNIGLVDESAMVHSSFFYAKHGGSQFLADTLARGLNIRYNCDVASITREGKQWKINGELYDAVVFAANLRLLPSMLEETHELQSLAAEIASLDYHGTTSVLCGMDANPYSWIYLPSPRHGSHRMICTGNFSPFNNADDRGESGRTTCTVEFSRPMNREEIERELLELPFHPSYMAHHYEEYTYPVQDERSRAIVTRTKNLLAPGNFHLLGRFAEWEYYNMDAAIGAAIDFTRHFQLPA